MSELVNKIRRKWMKLRLQPIRVFCFHHVTDVYDASTMWNCDWTNTDLFKDCIRRLQTRYTFISLAEAHEKLQHDTFRCAKYAVLTADDGFKSQLPIVRWLFEQKIPITLFVNPAYFSGKQIGPNVQERLVQAGVRIPDDLYMTKDDILDLASPLLSIGMHGNEHLDEWCVSYDQFVQNVNDCKRQLESIPGYIPYYAHTYGHTRKPNDMFLLHTNIVPVFVAGNRNYDNADYIDRELISQERIQTNKI